MNLKSAPPALPFAPEDAERAYHAWGANCGPVALAAILGLPIDHVRTVIPEFEAKRYTSPSMMYAALRNIGRAWRDRYARGVALDGKLSDHWPQHGLVRLQWEGPWMAEGVPIAARYRYTHWVGAHYSGPEVQIVDVNSLDIGSGWLSLADWSEFIVPDLTERFKRATGVWHITHCIEVERT